MARKTPTKKNTGEGHARRGRPPISDGGTSKAVFTRVDDQTYQRIEAHQARMRAAAQGSRMSISDAIRGLLLKGLDAAESTADLPRA